MGILLTDMNYKELMKRCEESLIPDGSYLKIKHQDMMEAYGRYDVGFVKLEGSKLIPVLDKNNGTYLREAVKNYMEEDQENPPFDFFRAYYVPYFAFARDNGIDMFKLEWDLNKDYYGKKCPEDRSIASFIKKNGVQFYKKGELKYKFKRHYPQPQPNCCDLALVLIDEDEQGEKTFINLYEGRNYGSETVCHEGHGYHYETEYWSYVVRYCSKDGVFWREKD